MKDADFQGQQCEAPLTKDQLFFTGFLLQLLQDKLDC